MRLLEIVLIVTGFGLLILPFTNRPNIARILALITFVIFLLHVVIERVRWQMYPAYIVIALLIVVNLIYWQMDRPIIARILAINGGLFLLVGLALASLIPIAKLAPLTGKYAVGTLTHHLIDESRAEEWSDDPIDMRQLMVQVWYPAEIDGEDRAPYIDKLEIGGPALARGQGLPGFILNHANLVKTRSYSKPAPVSEDGPYPVLLFSHGLRGVRTQNTQQVEELASQGYIVIAVDHAYGGSFTVYPDDSVALYNPEAVAWGTAEYETSVQAFVSVWADDLAFTLDQMEQFNASPDYRLHNLMNFEQVGVFGHSTGGGTAYEWCHRDARCKAAFGLDPWVVPTSDAAIEAGVGKPLLMMHTPSFLSNENASRAGQLWNNINGKAYDIEVAGTEHFDYTDFTMLTPILQWVGWTGPIGAEPIRNIMDTYLLAFFDHHLRGWGGAELFVDSAEFPQVTLKVK